MLRPCPPRTPHFLLTALLILAAPVRVEAQCCITGPMGAPAVCWDADDQIAGCPGGDTLVVSPPHPSRLRIYVHYQDQSCTPRAGVPPESIYVQCGFFSGENLKLNDKSTAVFADDSTNIDGDTWITLPSFSGCGRIRITLFVSGVTIGSKTRTVRTTDKNSDGNTTTDDLPTCDLNYNGFNDDFSVTVDHLNHWHRNALHGTLVRRTNYGEGVPGFIGAGLVYWSPSGRYLSYGTHPPGPCRVFAVPSDPKDGNVPTQLTAVPVPDSADYDPSWSPLNTEFTFGRFDNTVYRKGLPWTADTETHLVTHYDDGSAQHRGDLNGTISPDGQWVVFSRRSVPNSPYEIFKIPITGDEAQRVKLTALDAGSDFYPQWSPDGVWIIFQRQPVTLGKWSLLKIRADGSDNMQAAPVFDDNTGKNPDYDAATPAFSPDNLMVLTGYGPRVAGSHTTYTLNPALTNKKPIANYNQPQFSANLVAGIDFPLLSPRLSPDGTRLALGSTQVWAVRRNMSLPPRITQVGTQTVHDTTAKIAISAQQGLQTTVAVLSTDPENDPITCSAYFIQDGMSFNPSTCTLTWTPSAPVGTKLYVKFQVSTTTWPKASGGTDAIIAEFTVTQPGLSLAERKDVATGLTIEGPNPTHGSFALNAPFVRGAIARLLVFDVSGRQVAVVSGPSGSRLLWEGKNQSGDKVDPGIYLYRLEVGKHQRDGKFVVMR